MKDKSLKEVLESPFFMAFKNRRPYNENLLRPCTIIDNPQVLREAVKEGGAHPTHPGADSIITTLAPAIDEYANGYGELSDRVWEEEYEDRTYKPHLSLIGELMETRKDRRLKKRMKKNQAEPAVSR